MVRTQEFVPSFQDAFRLSLSNINTIHKWVSEEIEVISGSTAVGCFLSDKRHEQYTFGKFLYPTYLDWCKREKNTVINPRGFTQSVLDVCKDLGFQVEKKRTQSGYVIQGIGIKEKVSTLNYRLGGEVDQGTSETVRNSNVQTNGVQTLAPLKDKETELIPLYVLDESLDSKLVSKYVKALVNKSNLKRDINKHVRQLDIRSDIEKLIDEYCAGKGAHTTNVVYHRLASYTID